MDEKPLQDEIRNWLQTELMAVTALEPRSLYVDVILEREIARQDWIEVSLKAFRLLVNMLQDIDNLVQPALIIPLSSASKRVLMKIPTSNVDLQMQLSENKPPSLCLYSWTKARKFDPHQEFRAPLPFPLLRDPSGQIDVYYQELRASDAIDYDREFSRSVHLDYYPEGRYNLT
jgi:hypothetical protein